ncbi:MAG: hypothetical protein MUC54_08030, partial [Chloroflexi bacterium]|nr:hypothetical protein [Chloroflexota bacterium]
MVAATQPGDARIPDARPARRRASGRELACPPWRPTPAMPRLPTVAGAERAPAELRAVSACWLLNGRRMAPPSQLPLTVALSILSTLPAPAALAGWSQILAGRVERVAAAGGHAAALRGESVWLLREDGTSLGKLVSAQAADAVAPGRPDRAPDDDEVLDLLGVDESLRETDWAADQVENERTLRQRRLRRHSSSGRAVASPPVVAAAGEHIWIASQRGLWRIGPRGELARMAGAERAGELVSASAAGGLLVARGRRLWLATGPGARHDFEEDHVVQHVALSPSGKRMAWATSRHVVLVPDSASPSSKTIVMAGPVRNLAWCGETLVVLSAGGLTAVTPVGEIEQRSETDLHAERIVCPPDEAGPWLAVGPGLLASGDGGRIWSRLPVPRGARAFDAALAASHLWLATDRGLFCSSGETDAAESAGPHAGGPGQPPHRTRRWWFSWLPNLALQGGARFAPDG